MNHDAGALSKYRNKSSIFRYLSNNPPPFPQWPKGYFNEVGIFIQTPGITWDWVKQNFNWSQDRLASINIHSQHLKHLGMDNALSATYDDAVFYCQNKLYNGQTPFWAKPFILEDIKNGMKWSDVVAKWNIGEARLAELKRGRIGNVFHPSLK